jgi:MoaA/NifB/PqqE/SkfB family radical SAM enzyme
MRLISFIGNHLIQTVFRHRIKPRVLQMPITNRCGSRCITCEIWKNNKVHTDIDPVELKKILQDPYFSKVYAVGVNGGEPSLYPAIDDFLESLFVLKKLKRIYVISNGLVSTKLLEMMKVIKAKCAKRHIIVYLTISVDGVGDIHNSIRGLPHAFEKTIETLKAIKADKERYCDVLDVGCTLSSKNIPYVVELEAYLQDLGLDAWYHPSVPNKRLHNFEEKSFSLISDERSRMLAVEYFFTKFKYGNGLKTRLRAFLTYDYFLHHGSRRLAGCNYLRSDVTITENLDICLCAVASDIIGNLRHDKVGDLLKKGKFIEVEKNTQQYCQHCIHYVIFPSVSGFYEFIKELLKPSIWLIYKVLAIWSK